MVAALWVVGGLWAVIYFGTWIVQIGLWLLEITIRVVIAVGGVAIGLACLIGLALFDRPGLRQALALPQPLASPRLAR